MSRQKKGKIPRKYRKGLKEKKFKALVTMLTGSSERQLVENQFVKDATGKYRYSRPEDDAEAALLSGIFKKIHKARSGPRIIRLSVLAAAVAALVGFNLFFLDNLVGKSIEKNLELITDTDVTLEGFDIQLSAGRVIIEKLAFASTGDPMVDYLVLTGLSADIDWTSIFFRRVVFDDLSAEIKLNEPRQAAATYPGEQNRGKIVKTAENSAGFLMDFAGAAAGIGEELIPDATLNLLRTMRSSVETDSQKWSDSLSLKSKEVELLGEDLSAYISKPLPDKTDLSGWTSRIEEGNNLSEKLKVERGMVEQYRRDLLSASGKAQRTLDEARAAVDADMKQLGNTSVFNADMMNRLIETVLFTAAGPKAAEVYSKITGLILRISNKKDNGFSSEDSPPEHGRMKSGRIVNFPIVLPPRFSIRKLDISGEGIVLAGDNIGIDHDLAGAPSILSIKIDGVPGIEGRITSIITLDLRYDAVDIISGKLQSSDWSFEAADGLPGAKIAGNSVFAVTTPKQNGSPGMSSSGRIILSDWNPVSGSGPEALSFIRKSSPPLGFKYSLTTEGDETELNVMIDPNSLEPWKELLAESVFSTGMDQLKKTLPPEAEADLQALETVVREWDDKEAVIASLTTEIQTYEAELDALIEELSRSLPVDIPLPKASGIIGGVGSLFGN